VSSIAVNLLAAGLTGLLLNQVFNVYGTSPGVARLPELGGLHPQGGVFSGLRALFEGVSILVPAAFALAAG